MSFNLLDSVTRVEAVFISVFIIASISNEIPRRRVLLSSPNEITIDVIIDGKDNNPPVVLLPSSQRDSEEFDVLAELIAHGGYLVLRPQPRGIGDSCGPLENFTLHSLADDVATTIRQLGNGHRAVIVGHAFGHYIARVTDLDYPELVRGVIIAAGAQRYQNDSSLVFSLEQASNETLSRDERLKHLYHAFFAPSSDATVWLTGWHSELNLIYRNAAEIPSKNEWWPVTNSPILDLQADQDPWRPSHSRYELKDVLGDLVTVQIIEGASHALFPEQPGKVADAIINWIQILNSN